MGWLGIGLGGADAVRWGGVGGCGVGGDADIMTCPASAPHPTPSYPHLAQIHPNPHPHLVAPDSIASFLFRS